jgi:ectoine hydroxylase-related dioxygenase (phytanoyl-CoA dioxygenase family)
MEASFSSHELEQYQMQGFFIIQELFALEEIEALRATAQTDLNHPGIMVKADNLGNPVVLRMWNGPTHDLFGMFSRNERIVNRMEQLLGKNVYLYSAKMTMKDARQGGAWEWHQDYGYWYNYGCLFPSMASCLIALHRSTRENGCLQVLSGSQRLGRIDHQRIKEQTVADGERVEAAKKKFDLLYLEMNPGDAIFFDCNLLHRSDANMSAHHRWNFICSYNTVDNAPYKRARDYGNYEPLIKVPSHSILEFAGIHHA